jgi:hypothetical protein
MCLFMYLFMSNVLYSKIEIEIDTNNDELLETIWEHIINIREIKSRRYLGYL